MSAPGAAVTVGGKDSSLSPTSVYTVACGQSRVQIDYSCVEKLSQTKKPSLSPPEPTPSNPSSLIPEEFRAVQTKKPSLSPPEPTPSNPSSVTPEESRAVQTKKPSLSLPEPTPSNPSSLTPEESRAVQTKKPSLSPPEPTPSNPSSLTPEESRAALLRNKLLCDSGIRPSLPLLIEETLPNSLCSLNGKKLNEVGATGDELSVLGSSFAASTVKIKKGSSTVGRLPKIPKGTRDFGKEQMAIRERAFAIIVHVFKMHGATALDTPVFELRETLMKKYGEDSKLIYDLADQGGELCSLRYDLTVPFARYLAMNNINALKRYQIAKVYRRDKPSKGRYREFYQCDFDIAGQYLTIEPDFEVIKVLTQLLDRLNIGDYEIKLNHRKLLDGMLEICGVSSEKLRTVCSSIDKLDKQPFEQIKKELVEDKGLAVEVAEKIGTFVETRGPPLEILSKLKLKDGQFFEKNVSTMEELEILFKALERSKCLNKVVFDMSLARGLDYYTGIIFEAVFRGATQIGSIAAGGRYDKLVEKFSGKEVPAVGVSLGIERVFTIMEQLEKQNQVIHATETQVLVAILGKEPKKDVELAAELVSELWDSDISAEYGLNKRVANHIRRALESRIPWMVIVGESEQKKGTVKLKNMEAHLEEEIPRESMVEELRKRLNIS